MDTFLFDLFSSGMYYIVLNKCSCIPFARDIVLSFCKYMHQSVVAAAEARTCIPSPIKNMTLSPMISMVHGCHRMELISKIP